jgi:hypothetical protein
MNHNWTEVSNHFQALDDLSQRSCVVWPEKYTDKVESLVDYLDTQAWSKEQLSKSVLSLGSTSERMEQSIKR